ncbi:type I restriction endonuclease subunit R [Agriterribacter sp.]|uniref:type I restriction endonuclease subunit R n=1 Tax=Agriterribacter sp. TaxID=2821509 RepID=UPI002BE03F90|nr:type I restriction endonuclease subunit R [Agriterribacter sp.]HRO45344.1 type I restriction endonuclease subunit R [Agriterribacter sp.]HRQ17095.1 type I restriction endonuclease subunit R [Agriterribacter sp.]
MTRITENHIELLAIECLEALGYSYVYAPDIAADGHTPERENYEQVSLISRLQKAVRKINPALSAEIQNEAIKELQRIASPELLTNNETFHRYLTEGIPVSKRVDGDDRGDRVWLVDFNDPYNNEFVAANQFTIIENHSNKRPDIILFINGIPLVVMELKNAADENATIRSAFKQIETYKVQIPSLFTFNAFNIISDGLEARAGSVSAGFSRYMAWKTADGKAEASHLTGQLEILIRGMLNKETIIDLIRHFIVFEKSKKEDLVTGIISINTIKKLAAYHQYYAVNRAVESTLRAAGMQPEADASVAFSITQNSDPLLSMVAEDPEAYGLPAVKQQPVGDRKAGVVWHTQGSGKSLSMVFFAGKIVLAMHNPTMVIITDRNDLDDQLFDVFAASKQLLRQEPVQAENRDQLKQLLKVSSGGIVFTTIQKFQPEEGNVYELLSNRSNIVVIADEAHRTQYGFRAKTIDTKDAGGNITGKKVVYGFAKYLRDALPNATYLGFTGTPIESTDVNTPAVFGNYVDVYDIAQAVEDGATVKIYYESRLARVSLTEEGRELVKEVDDELDQDELTTTQKAKAKWTQLEALVGSDKRIKNIAKDIVIHFEERQKVFDGKGMIVTMSRRIAAALYKAIIALKPEWHNTELNKGVLKVVMTSASSDGPEIAKHHTSKQQRRTLAERMKDPADELKLVIVRDMWLTGFDAPSMHTLYIDKPMKGHSLMQAIARVNRVYLDKPGGLIVDYLGIAADLKKALSFYSDAGGKGDPTELQEQAVELMLEKLEVVSNMLNKFPYENYFDAGTSQKLSLILQAEEHILGLEDGKKRYINEVTALSKAFAIAIPHEQAMDVKDEVAFFQAVKARLAKFDSTGSGRTDEEIETTIRQVIDQALVSEQVIDVFDAAGIKKPDISILSEEFLLELKGMEHKNIAVEVLRKLLSDELKSRLKKNLVTGKTLMEMLENAIKKYHNKILTAAEVIDELIKLGKDITKMDDEAKGMNMTDYEYAFYTAVADNASARELMSKDTLRDLAVVLYEKVKQNASIDWTIKESVKAKLKVIVKRTLRQYGYPPDLQALATETVLKQAEMIAGELSGA